VRYTKSWLNAAREGGYFANPIDTSSGMGTSANDYYIHNVEVNYTRTISNDLAQRIAGRREAAPPSTMGPARTPPTGLPSSRCPTLQRNRLANDVHV